MACQSLIMEQNKENSYGTMLNDIKTKVEQNKKLFIFYLYKNNCGIGCGKSHNHIYI